MRPHRTYPFERKRADRLLGSIVAAGTVAVATFAFAQQPKPAELQEPALELVLEIDGRTREVALDKPFDVRVGDRTVRMKLTARSYRTFRAAGVEFRYPRGHGFGVDASNPNVTTWTLDGNDNVIIVFKSALLVDADTLRNQIRDEVGQQWGAAKAKIRSTETSIRLLGRKVKGTRLIVQIGPVTLHQEFFGLRTANSTVVIVIQEGLDGDKPTNESIRARKMLSASLRLLPG